MLPIFTLLGAFVATVSAFCGASPGSNQRGSFYSALKSTEEARGLQDEISPRSETTYQINVYMHVIHSSFTNLTMDNSTASIQVDVLNEWFAKAGFSFHLMNVTNTFKAEWLGVLQGSPKEYEIQSSLRQGTYADLNMYINEVLGELSAYATFPLPSESIDDEAFVRDGITVDPRVLPGSLDWQYNLGKIAVHELGHWLGLLHTFEGGCSGLGDEIYDTPAQKTSSMHECPTKRDSCGDGNLTSKPGKDPVHNHMDYSTDECRTEFTAGQVARMRSHWKLARAGL